MYMGGFMASLGQRLLLEVKEEDKKGSVIMADEINNITMLVGVYIFTFYQYFSCLIMINLENYSQSYSSLLLLWGVSVSKGLATVFFLANFQKKNKVFSDGQLSKIQKIDHKMSFGGCSKH